MKIIFLTILCAFFCLATKAMIIHKKIKAKALKRDGYTGMYRALKR